MPQLFLIAAPLTWLGTLVHNLVTVLPAVLLGRRAPRFPSIAVLLLAAVLGFIVGLLGDVRLRSAMASSALASICAAVAVIGRILGTDRQNAI